jgi:flavodoxin
MKIVYLSNAGHTKEYAEMLKKELKIEAIDIKEYKSSDEEIIYMGWIRAGIINGYNKMKNKNIKCVIGVGMAPNREDVVNKLINQNNINQKFFYLQGGMDISRLKGFNKFLFNMVKSIVNKSKKIENQEMKDILNSEGKFIKKENLKNIIEYAK